MMLALRLACALSLLVLGGCATAPPVKVSGPNSAPCLQVFIDDDARLAAAAIHDAQSTPVAGHPYLRVDRLLASLTDTLDDATQREAWLTRAAELDAQARALEHARLPTPPDATYEARLQACRQSLLSAVQQDNAAWPMLKAGARVADDYSTLRRALGVYALSSRVVMRGVARLQQQHMPQRLDAARADALAATRFALLPADGADSAEPAPAPWKMDALGMPILSASQRAWLFRHHAPEIAVSLASDDDLPGHVLRNHAPDLDTWRATVCTQLAYPRFDGRVLPQLVYTWWFAARTAQSRLDALAGALDGLSWRVTLDVDAQPLAYDVAHNCGCYHMFFPTERLRVRTLADAGTEPPWIPFTVPVAWPASLRVVLASGTHYVEAIAPAARSAPARHYQMQPYDELRNIAQDQTRVSLFDAEGLVPGSARGERWFLWPMGVVAPGSMRQWGRQATAFVGRRHFDDAHLFERYFVRASSSSAAGED